MSIGNDNNTRERKDDERQPTTYSLVKMSNPTSSLDKTSLNFMYKYGLLNISIAPKKEDNGDYVRYDYKNKIEIWLSYQHAMVLHHEINRLMQSNDPTVKSVGVYTKKDNKLITFSRGDDYGVNNYVISIYKLTPEGDVQNAYHYEMIDEKYASIVNFDCNTKRYDKHMIQNMEITSLLTVLEEYYKSASGAYAYMDQYYNRFASDAAYKSTLAIMDKLGIPKNVKGGNYSRGGSFFDNDGEASSSSTNNTFRNSTLENMSDEYQYED